MNKSIAEGVAGSCPFCHGKFRAGFDRDGDPVAMHSLPPCQKFMSLDIDAYVAAVRHALAKHAQD